MFPSSGRPASVSKVLRALADPEITTVVQVAPAVRVAWAEVFGVVNKDKQVPMGKLVAALKRLGFDYVFDTNFTADLTIMEEGSEFIERFTHRGKYRWPMFTSCCPGWVRFLKAELPNYTENLSTAKSPQQMFGAVAKSCFAEKKGIDPHKLFVVSIMPCSAKRAESELPTMKDACGDRDVDVVLTTREMVRLFRSDCIVPAELEEAKFDRIFEPQLAYCSGYYRKATDGTHRIDYFPLRVITVDGFCNVVIDLDCVTVNSKLRREAAFALAYEQLGVYEFVKLLRPKGFFY